MSLSLAFESQQLEKNMSWSVVHQEGVEVWVIAASGPLHAGVNRGPAHYL